MTRMYLSPAATTGAKILLILIECLIGLFNLVSYPIRKITVKLYAFIVAVFGVFCIFTFHADLKIHMTAFVIAAFGLAVGIFVVKIIHKILNKKVSPKIAFMINSPFGIRLNKYHTPMTFSSN